MKISNSTGELLEKINEHSRKPLKNTYEVSALMESAFNLSKASEFKDLIFTAKYINGLKNVLSNRIINGNDIMEKIFDEFNKNIQKFIELLNRMVIPLDEKTEEFFNVKYFKLDQESLANSLLLIEDLTSCKEYFNNNPKDLP